MKYNIMSVKEALEVLYCQGYKEISKTDFIRLFTDKFKLEDEETSKIWRMIKQLEKHDKITIKDDKIKLDKISISKGLRARLNDMEVYI